jgi:hypothetical protein
MEDFQGRLSVRNRCLGLGKAEMNPAIDKTLRSHLGALARVSQCGLAEEDVHRFSITTSTTYVPATPAITSISMS